MPTFISSKDNETVKLVRKLVSSSKYRELNKLFVIEGLRLCLDAVKSKIQIEKFFYTSKAKNNNIEKFNLLYDSSNSCFEVTPEIMSYMSDTMNSQGFLCICRKLDKPINIDTMNNEGIYIALEKIQDPSNMGNILRTVEALGIDGVFISDDSCDIYNPKVIRGSMGAVFRCPFLYVNDFLKLIKFLNKKNIITYASVPDENALHINNICFDNGGVLFVGNEGNGLSKESIELCKYKITIPMNGRAESLNASTAATIAIWEMTRNKSM